jgi:hypothetical protein
MYFSSEAQAAGIRGVDHLDVFARVQASELDLAKVVF